MARQRHKSRLRKHEQRKAVIRLFVATIAIVLFVYAIVSYLPDILINVAKLNSNSENSSNNATQDNLAPFSPRLNPLPAITAEEVLDLSGTAEPATTVRLYANNSLLANTKTNADGKFKFASVRLLAGANNFTLTATDEAGNTSKKSEPVSVTLKKGAPSLNAEASVNQDEGTAVIQGDTDPDPEAQVTVNGRRIIVTRDGTFSIEIKLQQGDNSFTVKAEDAAGNATEKELSVTYDADAL